VTAAAVVVWLAAVLVLAAVTGAGLVDRRRQRRRITPVSRKCLAVLNGRLAPSEDGVSTSDNTHE